MFARLRHHAFVGSDYQRDSVDAVRTRQHVLDEPLVPRHIDKPDTHVTQIQVGKANVDGNAAALLFRQPIGINARERTY